MDALSLFANVIAVVGAAKSVAVGLRRLSGLRFAPRQLLQLLDELSDFRTLLASVEKIIRDSLQPDDPAFNEHLKILASRAAVQISRISQLAETGWIGDIQVLDDESVKGRWKHWLRRSEIEKVSTDLRNIRQDIAAALTVMTASEVPRVRNTLRDIILNNERADLNFQRTMDVVGGISRQLATALPRINQLEETVSDLRRPYQSASQKNRPKPSELTGDSPCGGFCTCHCHRPSTYISPRWASSLIGIVMLSWSGVLGRPICSNNKCRRSQAKMLKIFHYFPSWFLSRLVFFQYQSTSTEGHEIFIRTPRIVPPSYHGMIVAQDGDVAKMQILFQEGIASPFDVNPYGDSYLFLALTTKRVDMCRFLLEQCAADPRMENRAAQTPLTMLWSDIFSHRDVQIERALKAVFGPYMDPNEDLKRFQFTPIHKIVLGLTRVDLHEYLLLSSGEIDAGCSLGRTPLTWAVINRNEVAVQILLSCGARLDTTDTGGRTAFYYAINYGFDENTDILQYLIGAAYARALVYCPLSEPKTAGMVLGKFTMGITDVDDRARASVRSLVDCSVYDRFSPLFQCAFHGTYNKTVLLLDAGASIDLYGPILAAVQLNRHSVIRLLLARGAETSLKDEDSMTILHLAGAIGDLETIEILAKARLCCIDYTSKDKLGFTALEEFDNNRHNHREEDDTTRQKCREAFLTLLRNPPGSDHICRASGPRPELDQPPMKLQRFDKVTEISEDEDENEQFFDARSTFGEES